MKRIYKEYWLILFLLLVFLTPLFTKTIHVFIAHHDHFHFSYANKPEINNSQDKCPICDYEFVKSLETPERVFSEAYKFSCTYIFPIISKIIVDSPKFLFNMRAPPSFSIQ